MAAQCGDLFDVWTASTVPELRSRLIKIAQDLGFVGVAEWNEPRATHNSRGYRLQVPWSNAEKLYGSRFSGYTEALGALSCAADPAEVALRRRWEKLQRAPFLVSQQPAHFRENKAWLSLRQDFGEPAYTDALAVPLPDENNQTRHLYFTSCEDVTLEQAGLAASLGSLYSLMSGLLEQPEEDDTTLPTLANGPAIALRPRELEVIRWAVAGKTLQDIAVITGLAYRTVRYHLEQARKRYGYATTQQTIVRAALDYQFDPLGQ